MELEETIRRRRRARARGGQPRVVGGGRGAATASRCFLRLLGLLLSSPGLLALVVCYCFLGAFLFRFLEMEDEVEPKVAVEKYRDDCIKELWHITERLNVLYEKNWTALVNEQLRLFERSIVSVAEAEEFAYGNPSGPQKQQSFAKALFYSVTIMTTIGFGKFTPKMPANKIAIMLFAGFGIPITMICLAYIGTFLAHGLQTAYAAFVPDMATEILCPLTDKIECKSHSGQGPQSLEIGDLEEDLRESSEDPYSSEHLSMGHRHKDKTNRAVKSNSIMLTTMNLALDDFGQNLTRSMISERHSLLVECEDCIVEQKRSNYTTKKVGMDVGDSSEASIEEDINSDDVNKPMKDSYKKTYAECSTVEKNNDPERHQLGKEWNSGHHATPSRIPLIGRVVTQPQHCLKHTLAETKYPWAASLSTRPPTPVPTKGPSRRGHGIKYDQDSSPLTGSDRHLCSTPSLATTPMDLNTSKQVHLPVWLIVGVLGLYICIGAAIFASWEGWAFLDGAFFCFMLLSTVGFGELVPGNYLKDWNSIQTSWTTSPQSLIKSPDAGGAHPWKLTSCCLYLLFGIILVASSISMIHKKWAPHIHTLRTTLNTIGNEYSEEEEIGEESDDLQDELREPSFNSCFTENTSE